MEGYSQSEYHIFDYDCEDDEEDEDIIQKSKIKYTVLKEEDFIDEEE